MTDSLSRSTGWLLSNLATGWLVGARYVPALIRLRNLPPTPSSHGKWSR